MTVNKLVRYAVTVKEIHCMIAQYHEKKRRDLIDGIKPGKDHRLNSLESGQWLHNLGIRKLRAKK